jgi:hypothetical protein
MTPSRMELVDEVERLRDALDAANERIASFERHVEREIEPKLLARAETVKAERDRLAEALTEARPYVFNRTQGDDWRAETARNVLGRVDAALAAGAEGER